MMKKILLMTGVISILLAGNVIYARQMNCSREVCNVENCIQTGAHVHNNYETDRCYVEGCTQIQEHTHNNCVNYNNCNNRGKQNDTHHNMRHH